MKVPLKHILPPDVSAYKLAFNMTPGSGNRPFLDMYAEDPEGTVRRFYWVGRKRKAFRAGDKVVQLMRLDGDTYLLASAGEVVSVPDEGVCRWKEIPELSPWVGKALVETHKGNTFSGWVFRWGSYTRTRDIWFAGLLDRDFGGVRFEGIDRVHLKVSDLRKVVDGKLRSDYWSTLKCFWGIYLLTDSSNGKMYVGSAYGRDGLAQRWSCYLDTSTGGNKRLVKLYEEDPRRFEDHFEFTVLEAFDPRGRRPEDVIARESYWKDVLKTREFGYNDN